MKNPENTVLIVDDTPTNIKVLLDTLGEQGFKVLVANDGESAVEQTKLVKPDLVLLDVMMPGMDGFETCQALKKDPGTRDIPVIFMTALADTVDKIRGFKVGAVDYVTKPIQHEEVMARVNTHLTIRNLQTNLEKLVAARTEELEQSNGALHEALAEVEQLKNRLHAENAYLQEEIKVEHNFEDIICQSDAFKKVLRQVGQVATTDATVLLLGETGTGKELIARAVHNISSRADRPLVKVNCAALPANLIESELFGHEKGAFTGALNRKPGRFELAHKGTIFLDEIGDLPNALQAKLLRVLQEGEFERVGGTQTFNVDVRVIAATNRNLETAITAGEFREDLYYRLNVFPITLPPLRDRKGDVSLLTNHFVKKYAAKIGKPISSIPLEVVDKLQAYSWPGNVRELENVIERAVILSIDQTIEVDEVLDSGLSRSINKEDSATLEAVEAKHIQQVLNKTNWQISGKEGAAARLGINASTLRSRMLKLGIEKPRLTAS